MYQITVDGVTGAGKTTVCQKVAQNLGIVYYNTDLAKSAIALHCVENQINPTNAEKVLDLLRDIKIDIKQTENNTVVMLNDRDVTRLIKNPMVVNAAYALSKLDYITSYLKILQLQAAKEGDIVVEGFDTGVTMFPGARFKFFLTATAEIRAERKYASLSEAGVNITYDEVLSTTLDSDKSNFKGEMSQIKIPEDCIFIDTSDQSEVETAQQITDIVKGR